MYCSNIVFPYRLSSETNNTALIEEMTILWHDTYGSYSELLLNYFDLKHNTL